MSIERRRGRHPIPGRPSLHRFIPFAAFTGLATTALAGPGEPALFLAALFGAGAFFTGRRLLDREANAKRELKKRQKRNVALLRDVAGRDRVAAPQMHRFVSLQGSVIESWDIMPDEYRELLDDDLFTILEEVSDLAHLARRRAALRSHLSDIDRAEIISRIQSLEREIRNLPEDSAMRQTFETTLSGRVSELESCGEMLDGISLINAQLESAESLLSNLRGDFLTLDTSLSTRLTGSGLARLKERVSLFKRSLDDVRYALGDVPDPEEVGYGEQGRADTTSERRQRPTEELPTR